MSAIRLWQSDDVCVWHACLEQHDKAIASKHAQLNKSGKKEVKLQQLQQWYDNKLLEAVDARKPAHMTRNELVKMVEWKLARDKWRPKLVQYAEQQDESTVKETTERALAAVEFLRSASQGETVDISKATATIGTAVDILTKLKGVGPGTASAILCCLIPGGYAPYMSPPAMAAAKCRHGDYTKAAYLQTVKALHDKATKLKKLGTGVLTQQQLEALCTAKAIERCLFSADVLQDVPEMKASGKGVGPSGMPNATGGEEELFEQDGLNKCDGNVEAHDGAATNKGSDKKRTSAVVDSTRPKRTRKKS